MAKVQITAIEVLSEPGVDFKVCDPFRFKIRFECHEDLVADLDWRVIYVGSSLSSTQDQELDELCTGPITKGTHEFILEVPGPDPTRLPAAEIVGVTVVLLRVFYLEQEFIRIGYYINNEYKTEEMRNEPPEMPVIEELRRLVCDNPRVTRLSINWEENSPLMPSPEEEAQFQADQFEHELDAILNAADTDPAAVSAAFDEIFAPPPVFGTEHDEMALD